LIVHPAYHRLVLLAVSTGLRRGELAGLDGPPIDLLHRPGLTTGSSRVQALAAHPAEATGEAVVHHVRHCQDQPGITGSLHHVLPKSGLVPLCGR